MSAPRPDPRPVRPALQAEESTLFPPPATPGEKVTSVTSWWHNALARTIAVTGFVTQSVTPADQARDLLQLLAALGIGVIRLADRLRVIGRPGAFTPELRAAVVERKEAIVALLTPHPCASCGRHAFPKPGTRCHWCRRGVPARAPPRETPRREPTETTADPDKT